MRPTLFIIVFLSAVLASAHVPVLLLPIQKTPVASYFLGQSEISRAIYSEITRPNDFFVAQFYVPPKSEGILLQILTPDCPQIPKYELFQPSGIIIPGDLPWKQAGESNSNYVKRLRRSAIAEAKSSYTIGHRPKYYEEFGKQSYWIGGEWHGDLDPGLYSLVIFDSKRKTGSFTVGLNKKEAWTPELFKYAAEMVKRISKRICSPKGYSGQLQL